MIQTVKALSYTLFNSKQTIKNKGKRYFLRYISEFNKNKF